MKYLGDIIIVEHIGKNISSKLILIPNDYRNKCGGILAKVLDVGFVHPQRRNKKKFYLQDELKKGDIVIVTEQFGTRNNVLDNPNAIIYASEDVHAIVSYLGEQVP